MRLNALLLVALIAVSQAVSAQITIAAARALPLGTNVTVKGIVTNDEELGVIRYIQDNTAGIGVYDFAIAGDIAIGDSILVSGPLLSFNNLLEISPTTSMTVLNSGNPLPAPITLTTATGFAEAYEGRLVRIPSCSFTSTGAFSAGSANYNITDAAGAAVVRVNGTTDIAGSAIPTDPVDIIGIMSQFSASSPTTGYQLLPRFLTDLVPPGNPPIISAGPFQTNLAKTSFTVTFETLQDGNTIIYYGTTPGLGLVASSSTLTTTHTQDLTGLTAGTLYFVQAASVSATNDTSFSNVVTMATVSNSSGDIRVWFNNPVDNSVSSGVNATFLNQTFDDSIIAVIDAAEQTLDIAIYNLDNDNGMVDAINAAYDRGVVVRLVADNGVNASAYSIIDIGFTNKKTSPSGMAPSGGFYGLMHNKFVVVDANHADPNKPMVLTGSTNWTDNQLLVDPNNIIVVQDQSLARAYRLEFEEMFSGKWGPEKQANTPTQFIIDGKEVELFFSGSDAAENRIIEKLLTTDNDVHMAIYNWTRFNLSYAVEDAVAGGAYGAALIEDIDTSAVQWTVLRSALGPNLFLENQPNLFHHKYAIVDAQCPAKDPMVITGSGNWTTNGTSRSDENFLVIHDDTIANLYYQEFLQRFKDNGGVNFATTPEDCKLAEPIGINGVTIEGLNLWPNPTTGVVTLTLPIGLRGDVTVTVMDLSGRQVHSSVRPADGTAVELDLSDAPAGLYLVRAESATRIFSGRVALSR